METMIDGIHHITAIASSAVQNKDFYTNVLGLRLVKKTVNFDDPYTYHLYYGNQKGEPGTIITFFPWKNIKKGYRGAGQVTSLAYSIPEGSIEFWVNRLEDYKVPFNNPYQRFDEDVIVFEDPDGLKQELIAHASPDNREGAKSSGIAEDKAIRGFFTATLSLKDHEPTARLLSEVFGYNLTGNNRFRFENSATAYPDFLDLEQLPAESYGQIAGGSIHHIAFRVENEEKQLEVMKQIRQAGFNTTEPLDRQYFKSIYFREPGGILFEIATDPPGFTADESINYLGKELKLPEWLEPRRKEIEGRLPVIG